MKERKRKQKNIIIGGLVAIVFLLSVGYAAFATNLNITGTSNITNTWDVEIINVTATPSGGAINKTATYTELSATIGAELTQPGDKVTYQIKVKNKGTLNAKLETVTMSENTNEAIVFTKKGIEQGSVLETNEEATLIVTIEYNPEVTEQPSVLTASTTITFNYVQSTQEYDELYTIEYYSESWRAGETSQTARAKVDERQVHFNEQGLDLTPAEMNLQNIGYNFLGWFPRTNCRGDQITTTTYSDLVEGDTAVKTKEIYACWSAKKYTLNYDVQGGSAIGSAIFSWVKKVGSTISSKIGYTFTEWNTKADGTGMTVTTDTRMYEILNYDENKKEETIYAIWSQNHYTVNYDSDGGSAVASKTVTYSETGLNSPQPTKQGYTFDGWYSVGGVKILDSTRFSSLVSSDTDGLAITLYAHWIEN